MVISTTIEVATSIQVVSPLLTVAAAVAAVANSGVRPRPATTSASLLVKVGNDIEKLPRYMN